MNLLQISKDLFVDIGVARTRLHRMDSTAKRFAEAVNQTVQIMNLLSMILKREGIEVDGFEGLPRALEALIEKLKGPADATS